MIHRLSALPEGTARLCLSGQPGRSRRAARSRMHLRLSCWPWALEMCKSRFGNEMEAGLDRRRPFHQAVRYPRDNVIQKADCPRLRLEGSRYGSSTPDETPRPRLEFAAVPKPSTGREVYGTSRPRAPIRGRPVRPLRDDRPGARAPGSSGPAARRPRYQALRSRTAVPGVLKDSYR